jgi:3-oxoacyl-[acyl-carrier protein] reductase
MTTSGALQGRLAVVTGASRGIGFHIASALHAAGATVAMTGREAKALGDAAREVGGRAHAFAADQRDPASIDDMARRVLEALGGPDILVNNAGVFRFSPVLETPLAEWNDILATNLTGVFVTTRAFLPAMLAKDRGDIFMISSMAGKKGDPGSGAYSASKFGLQGFSQSLMYEVRSHNIRVMVLNPSSVDTGPDTGPRHGKGLYLHAADLAATVVHLASLPGRTMIRDMDIYGTNPK